jgi:regulator of protease activity HflC (stomatin/prohibitin superfamily)
MDSIRKSSSIQTVLLLGFAVLLLLIITLFKPFVIINAGERGVIMRFGEVQPQVLGEGLHPIVPVLNTVKILSIRVQKHQFPTQAASRDLQDVFADVALNWHVDPTQANLVFQQIGDEVQVVERIINPAVEEVLKAVMAKYTAEEIITKRGEVKAAVDETLTQRLANYQVAIDDISLVSIHFSQRFSEAVEAKQIAEQESKRAEFIAQKAAVEAQAEINRAKGQAEAQRLVRETLTTELLQKLAIEKWDGRFPSVMGGNGALPLINLEPQQPARSQP